MSDYKVGDQIGLPPEPYIGTVIRLGANGQGFRMRRDPDGWTGIEAPGRRVSWESVLEAWLHRGIWIDELPSWAEQSS